MILVDRIVVIQSAIVFVDFVLQTGQYGAMVQVMMSILSEPGFHLPPALFNRRHGKGVDVPYISAERCRMSVAKVIAMFEDEGS